LASLLLLRFLFTSSALMAGGEHLATNADLHSHAVRFTFPVDSTQMWTDRGPGMDTQ
jgi:hypothetical protein